ncbi:tol-pal system-associated acyl-CoA thioesterase [Profundibacterium mesophilum]|uniref:4-hydroxybenzoyl-CoA thioesterase n=1 Tax=Profundibacterium mesophilum KAUST100406-0324 TaxID=1037889 RepID=A0A921NP59_9RHOB|nr:tol-pal system-associated acyl-CoA thioesterase [Profundibacterium mesophilum]KAF0675741.1 4-hydroxybenzoyl-CoA thioesterase [Profundibacterium mesophilum KAUST100406-0324]
MSHSFSLRVYYEDTDLGGIVYYANYLRFIERARSEWVRSLGIDQRRMKEEHGTVFAVRRLAADYLSPAHYDDMLTVNTALVNATGARLTLEQIVRRDRTDLFTAQVTLAAIGPDGRAARLPAELRRLLG